MYLAVNLFVLWQETFAEETEVLGWVPEDHVLGRSSLHDVCALLLAFPRLHRTSGREEAAALLVCAVETASRFQLAVDQEVFTFVKVVDGSPHASEVIMTLFSQPGSLEICIQAFID